jgi:hypothetical protein
VIKSYILEGLRDTGNQSGKSVLPGRFGLSVEGGSELFSKDFLKDGTELLDFNWKVLVDRLFEIRQ